MNDRASRLYFLDWIRIAAFFLLILYHTGMYYVTWGWHVKSPNASDTLEPWMNLSSPWRLSLLFFVSGVASAFLLNKAGAAPFVKQRSRRLLVPLVFGMFFIVPAQPYFEVVEKAGYAGSFIDFMQLYVRGYGGFCKDGDCLDLPTWNHLWFLPYLWLYTLLLAGLAVVLGDGRWQRAAAWFGRLQRWQLVALPLAVLAVARMALADRFPSTHALVDDFYNHANYLPLFLLGALLAQGRACWAKMEEMRFATLATALSCWAVLMTYYGYAEHAQGDMPLALRMAMRSVYAACQWCAILAVCGFGHRHLDFDSAKRRYLTEAVFPVYIVHQTLIIVLSQAIKPARHDPVAEGVILLVLTFAASFGVFEAVRRVPLLRPLFGLAPPTSQTSAYAVPARAGTA